MAEERDALREQLEKYVGKPMGESSVAPDPVNVPMIRHWVDALDDRNPVYLDEEFAANTRFGGIVAPPAMLQAWGMPRPRIEGIAERGGSPDDISVDNPISALDAAGFVGTLATNSELEFVRYLRPGDHLRVSNAVDSISNRKTTGMGQGYFITWITTYTDEDGEVVGRQLFRVFKFDPSTIDLGKLRGGVMATITTRKPSDISVGDALPEFVLPVTSTVIVAGAIASRDFMPVHHDADYARAKGSPHMFMNILTTNGYVARFVTDWAGPEAMVRSIKVRLGAPAIPEKPLRFTGEVLGKSDAGDQCVVEVSVRAANDLGDHATGTVTISLPRS